MIDAAASLFLLLQIFFVDLLLGADNAIVIALACGRLRPEDTRRAIVLGAGGAIVAQARHDPVRQRAARRPAGEARGRLDADRHRPQRAGGGGRRPRRRPTVAAARPISCRPPSIIMLADAAMSLDNVVALAAIAGGSFWLLALGVLISIPILVYGAFILTRVLSDRSRRSSPSARRSSAGSPAAWRRPTRCVAAGSTPTLRRSACSRRRSAPCSCSRPEKACPGPIAGFGRRPSACPLRDSSRPRRPCPLRSARRPPSPRARRSPSCAPPPRRARRKRPPALADEAIPAFATEEPEEASPGRLDRGAAGRRGLRPARARRRADHLRRLVLRQPDLRHSVARDPTEKP